MPDVRIYARASEDGHIEANMGTKKVNKPQLSRVALPRVVQGASEPLSDLGDVFELDRVVSEARAAEILGYSKDTLRREFRAGRGPPRVRLSARRIGYRLSVLYALLDARTEQPGVIRMSHRVPSSGRTPLSNHKSNSAAAPDDDFGGDGDRDLNDEVPF